MNREIKFRAWDQNESRMHYGVESCIYEDPDEIISFDRVLELACYEVMQYTGIKDKDGKEIYEGDIILCGDGKVPTQVLWVDEFSGWGAKNLKRNEIHALDKYFTRFIGKIIGNIYENPELV